MDQKWKKYCRICQNTTFPVNSYGGARREQDTAHAV